MDFTPLPADSQFKRLPCFQLFCLATVLLGSVVSPVEISAQDLTKLGSAQQLDVKQSVEKILNKQTSAWNQGDLERFMDTYWRSDQLTFSAGGSTTRGWQATLDRYKKKYSTPELMGRLRFDQLEITLLENHTALVLGSWHLAFANAAERHGNFSLVMTLVDQQWRIIHDHSSESN
jgi:uncharacterized protein (TIGR02246 family)